MCTHVVHTYIYIHTCINTIRLVITEICFYFTVRKCTHVVCIHMIHVCMYVINNTHVHTIYTHTCGGTCMLG
jgi:hypothetical protein